MQDTIKQHMRQQADQWALFVRDSQARDDAHAIEFAKLLIQSLLLIHGGALVALPSFEVNSLCWKQVFYFTAVFGLASGVGAGICAFFAMVYRAEYYQHQFHVSHYASFEDRFKELAYETGEPLAEVQAWNNERERLKAELAGEQQNARYRYFRLAGIILVAASTSAIIFAAGVGLQAFL